MPTSLPPPPPPPPPRAEDDGRRPGGEDDKIDNRSGGSGGGGATTSAAATTPTTPTTPKNNTTRPPMTPTNPPAPATPLSPLTPPPNPRMYLASNRSLSGGVRSSRFIEVEEPEEPPPPLPPPTPMFEYTPANSISDADRDRDVTAVPPTSRSRGGGGGSGGRRRRTSSSSSRDSAPLWIALRTLNRAAHLAVCAVLLVIMFMFLARAKGWYRRNSPEAVALVTMLIYDVVLDLHALGRVAEQLLLGRRSGSGHDGGQHQQTRWRWPGLALVLRLLLGVGYLALFMVYIGIGGEVFPPSYTYWGIESNYTGTVVYLLMWVVGVWNLVQCAVHRHQIGRALRCFRRRDRRSSREGNGIGAAAVSTRSSTTRPRTSATMVTAPRQRVGSSSGGSAGGWWARTFRIAGRRNGGSRGSNGSGGRGAAAMDLEAHAIGGLGASEVALTSRPSDLTAVGSLHDHRSAENKAVESMTTLDTYRTTTEVSRGPPVVAASPLHQGHVI